MTGKIISKEGGRGPKQKEGVNEGPETKINNEGGKGV